MNEETRVREAQAQSADSDPGATTDGDPGPAAPDAPPPSSGRYALGAEIARGGMGVVYRAADAALGREVAVKVLQERFGPDSNAARRFATEARITGGLQHPGIPPVHDLGTLPDGRPYLAMKLIEGETLADLIRQRPDAADRGRFVAVFEAICQAVAYAHSRGIIHRDLKPANVMVGEFGEVQVMDWGLAKVLGGPARGAPRAQEPTLTDADPSQTTDHHHAGESTDDRTRAGQAMGTPAYMPPEQARGDRDRVDRRSDVFALGGVLCAVLTGKPPYTGAAGADVFWKAADAKLGDALARLDGCGADAELVDLCKRCLAPEPADRPADAGEVARLVAGYRAGVEQRLREAERDRAAAEAKAGERRKRRRVWLGAAAALVVAVVGGLSAVLAVQRRAAAELSDKNDDLVDANVRTEAALVRAEAREQVAVDAVGEYRKAVEDNPALRDEPHFADLRRTLLEAPAEFCRRLGDDLRADPAADAQSSVRLARVLYQLGRLRDAIGRKEDALAAFAEADDLLARSGGDAADWQLAAEVLLRKGMAQDARADYAGALATFARSEGVVAARLRARSDEAVAIERLAMVLYSRALTLSRTKRQGEAVAAYRQAAEKAAESARLSPGSNGPHFLAFQIALFLADEYRKQHRPDDALRSAAEAEAALGRYRAVAKSPESVLRCEADLLGVRTRVYEQIGKTADLGAAWKRAVEVRRELVARRPSGVYVRQTLAQALLDQGSYFNDVDRPEDALPLVREARRICEAHYQADPSDTSTAAFSSLSNSWTHEGVAHYKAGRPEDAIAAFREVSRLQRVKRVGTTTPAATTNFAGNEYNLGILLSETGRVAEAMTAYRRALDLYRGLSRDHPDKPEYRLKTAFALANMGNCLLPTDLLAAENHYRDAVAILSELAARYPKAASIRSGLARNRMSLAIAHREQGKLDGAMALLRESLRADAEDEAARKELAWLGRMRTMLPRLPAVLSGTEKPASTDESLEFALLCTKPFQKRYAAAARLYGEAFAADPKRADDLTAQYRYNAACLAARAGCGEGAESPADSAGRAALRAKALGWLRADLALRKRQAESPKPAERKAAGDALAHWLKDSDLAGIRPGVGRAEMPAAEASDGDAFWAEVKSALDVARKPPPKKG